MYELYDVNKVKQTKFLTPADYLWLDCLLLVEVLEQELAVEPTSIVSDSSATSVLFRKQPMTKILEAVVSLEYVTVLAAIRALPQILVLAVVAKFEDCAMLILVHFQVLPGFKVNEDRCWLLFGLFLFFLLLDRLKELKINAILLNYQSEKYPNVTSVSFPVDLDVTGAAVDLITNVPIGMPAVDQLVGAETALEFFANT